ncbi:MAG: hypothetical protein ACTS44_00980 [Candidatus Hodgkinia cicadicola]
MLRTKRNAPIVILRSKSAEGNLQCQRVQRLIECFIKPQTEFVAQAKWNWAKSNATNDVPTFPI